MLVMVKPLICRLAGSKKLWLGDITLVYSAAAVVSGLMIDPGFNSIWLPLHFAALRGS